LKPCNSIWIVLEDKTDDVDFYSKENIIKTTSEATHSTNKRHIPTSGVSQPRYFLVQHSQSVDVPDCPDHTSVLWSGYSLYSYVFEQQTITQDLGSIDSCVRLIDQAYYSYCSVPPDCGRVSTASWLSDHNASISRCTVCHIRSIPLTLHSQSTTTPSCPSNWSPLWQGFSHIQVNDIVVTSYHWSMISLFRMFWANLERVWHLQGPV